VVVAHAWAYRTIVAHLSIDEITVQLLMGAALKASARYITRLALPAAQAKISKRIVGLLGIKL